MKQASRFAGFGGQGVISAGVLLAKAAVKEGYEVTQTQSYGPESRGGAAKCDVIVADERILFPYPRQVDVFTVMSRAALEKYLGALRQDGILLVDRTMISEAILAEAGLDNLADSPRQVLGVPATDIAEKELGNRIAANMVMLGALCRVGRLVSYDAFEAAVREQFGAKPAVLEINLRALEAGYHRVAALSRGARVEEASQA